MGYYILDGYGNTLLDVLIVLFCVEMIRFPRQEIRRQQVCYRSPWSISMLMKIGNEAWIDWRMVYFSYRFLPNSRLGSIYYFRFNYSSHNDTGHGAWALPTRPISCSPHYLLLTPSMLERLNFHSCHWGRRLCLRKQRAPKSDGHEIAVFPAMRYTCIEYCRLSASDAKVELMILYHRLILPGLIHRFEESLVKFIFRHRRDFHALWAPDTRFSVFSKDVKPELSTAYGAHMARATEQSFRPTLRF